MLKRTKTVEKVRLVRLVENVFHTFDDVVSVETYESKKLEEHGLKGGGRARVHHIVLRHSL